MSFSPRCGEKVAEGRMRGKVRQDSLTGIGPKSGFRFIANHAEDQQPGNLKSWMRVCQLPLGRYMPTIQKVQSSTGSTVIW
jgi:hypothetical protein